MDYCSQGIIYQPEAVAKLERYYLPYLHVADCGTDIRLGMSLHSVLSAYRSLEEADDVHVSGVLARLGGELLRGDMVGHEYENRPVEPRSL